MALMVTDNDYNDCDNDDNYDDSLCSVITSCSPWLGLWSDIYSTRFIIPTTKCLSSWCVACMEHV